MRLAGTRPHTHGDYVGACARANNILFLHCYGRVCMPNECLPKYMWVQIKHHQGRDFRSVTWWVVIWVWTKLMTKTVNIVLEVNRNNLLLWWIFFFFLNFETNKIITELNAWSYSYGMSNVHSMIIPLGLFNLQITHSNSFFQTIVQHVELHEEAACGTWSLSGRLDITSFVLLRTRFQIHTGCISFVEITAEY